MINKEKWLRSTEKHITHDEYINPILFKWVSLYFSSSRLVTMPGDSGRQENLLVRHILTLEAERGVESGIELHTFDRKLNSYETGIDLRTPKRLWTHHKGDIFQKLLDMGESEKPTAAWFDMTGVLHEKNRIGLRDTIGLMFSDSSLMFITLAVAGGTRGAERNSSFERYIGVCGEGLADSVLAADFTIRQTISNAGSNKYLSKIQDPYTYKHGGTWYSVFSYIVGKHEQ